MENMEIEKIILSALVNQYLANYVKDIKKYGIMYIPKDIAIIDENIKGYKKVETAAIAKSCEYLNNKGEEIIYENTIGMTLHGIDLISVSEKQYIIYEVKGTTKKLRSPKFYLRKTKFKGKQLSWLWCWKSLCELAYFPLTANVFLKLYKKIINKKVKRKLIVVECEKLKNNYFRGKKINIFNAEEILNDDYDFHKEKTFLKFNQNIAEKMRKYFLEQIIEI
jgi:hypothetical protein